jgi:hypothetical protein
MAKENFTAERLRSYQCESGKQQTIHWDAKTPGLGLRVTQSGTRTYVFESRLFGKTIRIKIGDPRSWDLSKARVEAGRLKTSIDQGLDPRELKAKAQAEHEAKAVAEAARAVTVGEAWAACLEDRRPHWGERHYQDYVKKAQAGGQPPIRGTRGRGETIAGPLYSLMSMRLCELDSPRLEAWASREAAVRQTSAQLAWHLLKGFFT